MKTHSVLLITGFTDNMSGVLQCNCSKAAEITLLFSWRLRVEKERALGMPLNSSFLLTNLDTNDYGGEVHGHSIMSLPLSMMMMSPLWVKLLNNS